MNAYQQWLPEIRKTCGFQQSRFGDSRYAARFKSPCHEVAEIELFEYISPVSHLNYWLTEEEQYVTHNVKFECISTHSLEEEKCGAELSGNSGELRTLRQYKVLEVDGAFVDSEWKTFLSPTLEWRKELPAHLSEKARVEARAARTWRGAWSGISAVTGGKM